MQDRGPLGPRGGDLSEGLARSPSCSGCGASEPAPSFAPLRTRCGCGREVEVHLPTAAELRTPCLGKALIGDRRWVQALRARAAGGPFLLAPCPDCSGPLAVPPDTPLSLACQYCRRTAELPLVEHAVDVLPTLALSARTWGGGLSLRWVPEVRHAAVDGPSQCPHCAAKVPPFAGSAACPHCDGALFAFTACGRRFLPGVRVEGDDEGQRPQGWLPLPEALEHYTARVGLVRGSERTTCAMIGLWTLFIPVFCLISGVALLVLTHLNRGEDASPGLLIGGWLALMAIPVLGFAALIATAVLLHRRRRDRLTGGK